jgi:hypothetical protein
MIDPDELLDLKREEAWERKRERKLAAHPDCRGPYHPDWLCPLCNPEDEE